ncbi:hypothetical protein [Terriglobus aquaticus]|uniref:Outer membrane protein beta-barrel domain-containing protein n=1 Tax=Terriglobus aquaticus TaxID=940139 RepID=A0ABW9KIG1_9BACT|nr:hypothetical protein [Terriglobus aquaticus]
MRKNQTYIKKLRTQAFGLGACATMLLAALGTCQAQAGSQSKATVSDLAITFAADRTNPVNGANTWLLGGSAELGAVAWKGLGPVVKVTGLTSDALASQRTPLNLVVTVFGPRYRFQPRHASGKLSVFGEGMLGIANGFRGLFPSPSGSTTSSNSMALEVGGGVDWQLARHVAVRPVEASWLRTQFNNSTTNVQNHLILEGGLALRF